MKKRVFIVSFSIVLLVFAFLLFASANGYSDNTPIPNSVYCSDTDRGVYLTMNGIVTSGGKNYTDTCYILSLPHRKPSLMRF